MEQKNETAARVQEPQCVKGEYKGVTGVLALDGRSLLAANGLVMTADGKLALDEGELQEMFTTDQRTVLDGITELISRNNERHLCLVVLNYLEVQQQFGAARFPGDKILPMYCHDTELRSCVNQGIRAVKTLLKQREEAERRAAAACRQLVETMGDAARSVIERYGIHESLRYMGVLTVTEYCHGTT